MIEPWYRICRILALAGAFAPLSAQPLSQLKTRWASQVSSDRVLPEYPRPQLVRQRWRNLNGNWEYAIRDSGTMMPKRLDGTLLVPFPIESQLSGVGKSVTESQWLWYRRTFTAPRLAPGERLLLHFGAVDWEATVSINGREVGRHQGGYDPFTFDITEALRKTPTQEVVVRVWDPTTAGSQPRGKQSLHPSGIFYTAVTGIWQTVWLEPVPHASIRALDVVPDVGAGTIRVCVDAIGADPNDRVYATALDGGRSVGTATGRPGDTITIRIPHARLWSPNRPFLYTLQVRLASGDRVESYFGMRTIAVARDSAGVNRLFLNGQPLFELGMLDQGWWPDGLYTAPTDAALQYDIEQAKRLSFNLLRKHVKVEPARWYYHADRLGILVWQDMPAGDNGTPQAREEFANEFKRVVDALRVHPSIVMWVAFNEGWGQHDILRYVDWLKSYDPTRLVDNASGIRESEERFQPGEDSAGDVVDLHQYPGPAMPPLESHRAAILGEFGGLGLSLTGHLWVEQGNNSYVMYHTQEEMGAAYRALIQQLRALQAKGLAAAVYTQVSDVETEVNGLLTYDRAIVKLPINAAHENATLFGSSTAATPSLAPRP